MPTPFETIKSRLRDAVEEILRGDGQVRRPARVTVVRTERPAGKRASGADTLPRVYRLLDDLKLLVGDFERVVAEARGFLPAKKKKPSSGKKGRKKGGGRSRTRSAGAGAKASRSKAAGKRRTRRAPRRRPPAVRTESTTIVSQTTPRGRAASD